MVMIFGQRRHTTAARRHSDGAADSKLARQLFAYEMLAARRNQQDSMLWQTPALALTAQAFLLTIALGVNAASVFARALAAGLGLVVAFMSMQLMAKHRHLTELDNAWLAAMEQEIGLAPVAARGVDAGVGPRRSLAMSWAIKQKIPLPGSMIQKMLRGLSYLTSHRLRDGLAFVVHPWETGCDDSPRWDSWYGSVWNQEKWTDRDGQLVASTIFDPEEDDARWNSEFVCAPSLFNAILSHALFLASDLTGDRRLRQASFEIGEAMDELLWDDRQAMYVDRPLVGGGDSCTVPVLDGVLSALGSVRRDRALACLEQLRDPSRFAAPWGLRYLPRRNPLYQPDYYWRGPAWPQLTFLAVQACRRRRLDDPDNLDDLAAQLSEQGKRAIIQTGWSEYWNAETGRGLGARPQTWAALAAAL